MTQNVTLEDGSVHTFPDDATPDEMTQALATAVPPPQQLGTFENFGNAVGKGYNQLGMGLLTAGTNVDQALGVLSPQDAQSAKDNITSARKSLDTTYPTDPGATSFIGNLLGQQAPALLDPAALLFGGFTNAMANSNPQSSPGGQLANTALDMGVSKVGGEAMNKVMQGAGQLGSKALNSLYGVTSPLLDAYNEAGITPRLVGDVSQNPFMQQVQAMASKLPLGASQVEDAANKTLDEFGNSVEQTAAQYGNSRTLQEAGTAVQNEGKQWLVNAQKANSAAWDDVNNTIGPQAPVSTNNLKDAVNTLSQSAQGNQALTSTLQSPVMKNVVNVLQEANGQPLTWGQTSALRTLIGQNLENPMLISGSEQAQSKLLYGALTKDMQNGAFASGNPDALTKFQNANALTSQTHDFVDNILGDVLKTSPEQAASTLLASGVKGGSQLQALRTQMPAATDELAAVCIRRAMAGQSEGAIGNQVSPQRWLTNSDPTRRMSPEAYQALFPDADSRSKMAALDMVAGSMRNTAKYVNQSNSGGHIGTMLALSAPIEGAIAGAATGGPHGALFGSLAGSVPAGLGYGSGLASTSPGLARFLSTPSSSAPLSFIPYLGSKGLLPEIPQQGNGQ